MFTCKILYRYQIMGIRFNLQKNPPLWKWIVTNILLKYVIFKGGLRPFLHILLSFSGLYLVLHIFCYLLSLCVCVSLSHIPFHALFLCYSSPSRFPHSVSEQHK